MAKKSRQILLIDGNALIHRAFHALPPLTTSKGELINAVFGFTSVLLKAIRELKPTHIVVAFDKKGPTFRHKLYKEYKATREAAPKELYQQIPRVHEVVRAFNIPYFETRGYEADDIIGTLSKKVGMDNVIVTGDLDALQLVDDDTTVYTMRRGVQDTIIYDEEKVEERYGLIPKQLIDYKGLRGDQSDNIPGVPGIGEKTAAKLLQEFGSIEEMYDKLQDKSYQLQIKGLRGGEKLKEKLLEYKDQALLSKKLGEIALNVPLKFDIKKCILQDFDRGQVIKLFQELGFKSLVPRLPQSFKSLENKQMSIFTESQEEALEKISAKKKADEEKYFLVDNEKKLTDFLKKLSEVKEFALDTETTSTNSMEAKLLGVSFCWKGKEAYYIPETMLKKTSAEKIIGILKDSKIRKVAHNVKYDYIVMRNYGIKVAGMDFDTMIASYLLNAGSRRHNLDDLVFAEFGHEMISYEDLVGKGAGKKNIEEVDVKKLAVYSCEDVDYTWRLKNIFADKLNKNKKILRLFEKVEMPLVMVLAEMETLGVKINSQFLKSLSKDFTADIDKLVKKIYKSAGTRAFNINSTQQLSDILFKKLKISTEGIKKTTKGYSTAASELIKIKDQHKIIPLIEEYRELVKLKNTYLDTLPTLINKETGRVHTSYNQTITATGRLSSSDPNLQNIPIRTKIGQQIRKAFIAEPGFKILSADYSQIELRVIAHVSDDKNMIKAFKENQDIHAATASLVFGKEIDDITKAERRVAKTINFGIFYGMSAYGLSQRLRIDREEAKKFIDAYFNKFPAVSGYIEKTLKFAKKNGYVETLTGRRRYLPELKGQGPQVAAAERMAVNMPIQGLGADIIKIAMIDIHQELKNSGAKMIMQVHDELVFEVKEGLLEKLVKKIKKIMEGAYPLKIPLKVDLAAGKNWGEMRRMKI